MVTLRSFTPSDIDCMMANGLAATQKEASRLVGKWEKNEYSGKFFTMYAVEFRGTIVGTCSLFAHSESVVSIGIEIFPRYRRKGFAAESMARAADICRAKGYVIVCQQIGSNNEASIALHKKLGFESDYYPYINRKGEEVYLFLKSIWGEPPKV